MIPFCISSFLLLRFHTLTVTQALTNMYPSSLHLFHSLETGSVLLADSKLNGLSRLHRTKDSFIGPDSESGLMFADVTVGVQCLNLTGFAEISLMGLRITSPLFFEMANTEINVKSYLDPKPGNNKPIIDDLTVTELEGVTLDLPAIGFAGSTLIDMGIKLLLTTFRGSLKEALRMNLLRFVDKAVHKSHLRLN